MDRYQEFRNIARALDVDAVALVPGANFTRLFKQSFHSMERPLVVIIPQTGDVAAIVPNLELGSFEGIGFEGRIFDYYDQTGFTSAFDALAQHLPLKSLAVEGQIMRVFTAKALEKSYGRLNIIDADKEIAGLRLVKTDDEIKDLEKAIEISELALEKTVQQVKIGMTEKEIESMLIAALFAHGSQGLAFDPIIAAGDNSAKPHAHARDYKIQHGDALLIDFGAVYNGLNADITRTFFVGDVSDEGRAVYETVLRANEAAFAVTRAGVSAHEIDDAATSVLEASPFAARIKTKTGHGLGRQVHEAPYIMRGNQETIPEGAVYTNEPGLYALGKFGVRIEDDVLVTKTGARNLTKFSKELRIIGL